LHGKKIISSSFSNLGTANQKSSIARYQTML